MYIYILYIHVWEGASECAYVYVFDLVGRFVYMFSIRMHSHTRTPTQTHTHTHIHIQHMEHKLTNIQTNKFFCLDHCMSIHDYTRLYDISIDI